MRNLLTCLVLIAIVGCGKKSEEKVAAKIAENMLKVQLGEDINVDITGESFSMKGENGETLIAAGKSATIPSNFPKDIHIYAKATVESTMNMPTGTMVTMLSKDDMTTILAVYKKEMSSKGWTEQLSMNMGEQAILNLEKQGRTTNITLAKDEESGGTHIMLVSINQSE